MEVTERSYTVKIGIISDIHIDTNNELLMEKGQEENLLETLIQVINETDIGLIIIAGDISSDHEMSIRAIKEIEEKTGRECLFVPGNHDIWKEKHPQINAWGAYEKLKKVKGNLANGPIQLNDDWVIIGDIGWYDYSYGGNEYTTEDFDNMVFGERVWQDKIKSIWNKSTIEMNDYFYNKIVNQLEHNKGKNIILVTHVVQHKSFIVQNPNDMWNYMNAFLGSSKYGELIYSYPIKYSIFGHVHYNKIEKIEDTTFICSCLGDAKEWPELFEGEESISEIIKKAINIIEVD